MDAILHRVVREGLSSMLTFELRPEKMKKRTATLKDFYARRREQ